MGIKGEDLFRMEQRILFIMETPDRHMNMIRWEALAHTNRPRKVKFITIFYNR
jgi:hypothetical protein